MGVKIYYYTNYEEAMAILSEGIIRTKTINRAEPGVYFTEVPPNYAKTQVQLNTYTDGYKCLQGSAAGKRKSLPTNVCLAFDANAIGARCIATKWWRNEWMTTDDVSVFGISQLIIRND